MALVAEECRRSKRMIIVDNGAISASLDPRQVDEPALTTVVAKLDSSLHTNLPVELSAYEAQLILIHINALSMLK